MPVLYTSAQAYNTRLLEVDCTTYPKFVGQVEYGMVGYVGVDYDLVDCGNVDCSRVDYCGSRGTQQCRLSQRTAQAQGTQSKHKGN